MESFSINCTTCHAALKVRKPEAIGQIYACPSCGGMVLIRRPEPAPAEGDSADATGSHAPADSANPAGNGQSSASFRRKRRKTNDAFLAKMTAAANKASYDQVDSLLGSPDETSKPATASSAEPASQPSTSGSPPVQNSPGTGYIGYNPDS